MHMANELLSVPVVGATLGMAAAGLGFVCKSEGLVLDYDVNGNLVGIDIDNASKRPYLQKVSYSISGTCAHYRCSLR